MNRKAHRADRKGAIDWDKQLRFDVEYAKAALFECGGLTPTFIVHCPEGTRVYVTPWRNEGEKRATQRVLALRGAADGAVGITFIGEAWMLVLRRRPGESEADYNTRLVAVPPSEAEGRQEVLLVTSEFYDADGAYQALSLSLDIVRNAAGKITGAPQRGEVEHVEMHHGQMLAPTPPDAEQRRRAGLLYDRITKLLGFQAQVQIIHPAGHA
jgi:hypothetical protein